MRHLPPDTPKGTLWQPNPTVSNADVPRVGKQARTILDLLRAGPRTNVELSQVGMRFGARIHELRAAGHDIVTVPFSDGTGRVTYRLVESGVG